ncbi:MAG: hypothetical protein MUF64_04520 [Polyangiaceae bacterium]|nr:hypothetical protein [Polyangiaceae bacterium]
MSSPRTPLRRLAVVLSLLLVAPAALLVPSVASAQTESKTVGHATEGPGGSELQGELKEAASSSDEVNEKVRKGLAKRGLAGKLEGHLAPPPRRKALDSALQAIAKELGLDAVVIGIARKKGDTVLIGVDAAGKVLLDTTVSSQDRLASIKVSLQQAGITPPPPPPPSEKPRPPVEASPPPPPAEPAAPPPEEKAPRRSVPLLSLAVGPELSMRRLRYNDAFTPNLRSYDVFAAPGVGGAVELGPLARTHVPILRRLVLLGSFSTTLGLRSSLPRGETLATSFRRWRVGARLTAPLGDRSHLGAEVTYGGWSFLFDGGGDDLPDASYRVLRGGLDARLGAGPVALLLGAGYGQTREAGPAKARFPRIEAGSVDARLGVALPLHERFELRLGGDYQRFFSSFNPEPGDRFVAGGALDQSLTVHLDAVLQLLPAPPLAPALARLRRRPQRS